MAIVSFWLERKDLNFRVIESKSIAFTELGYVPIKIERGGGT